MSKNYEIEAAKFDYMYLGKSRLQIANNYGFNPADLDDEIEISHWERRITPTALPETNDLHAFAEQLEKLTRSKLSIVSLFRQIDNQAIYAQIEKALLDKMVEAVDDLNTLDDKMASKLNTLASVLKIIQEREPINLADQLKGTDGTGSGVTVNIANMIN